MTVIIGNRNHRKIVDVSDFRDTYGIDVARSEGAKLKLAPMFRRDGHRHSDFVAVVIARIPETQHSSSELHQHECGLALQ